MSIVYELFVCQCSSIEHQVVFSYDKENEDKDVYVLVHLVPERSIWCRILNAIKYIFGYKCRYGHFEEFIFNKEDAGKLQEVVNYLKS